MVHLVHLVYLVSAWGGFNKIVTEQTK
jgi:hypothetical protein